MEKEWTPNCESLHLAGQAYSESGAQEVEMQSKAKWDEFELMRQQKWNAEIEWYYTPRHSMTRLDNHYHPTKEELEYAKRITQRIRCPRVDKDLACMRKDCLNLQSKGVPKVHDKIVYFFFLFDVGSLSMVFWW